MRLDFLQPLLPVPGPFATAYLDTTRASENAAHEIELRWRGVREALAAQGAPDKLLDMMGEAALRPTGVAGSHGLLLLGAGDDVVFQRTLPYPPQPDFGTWEPLPHLLPMVAQLQWVVPHLLVVIDRTGADITVVGPTGERVEEHSTDVAADVDRLAAQTAARLVAVAGDQRAATGLKESLGTRASGLFHSLETGGRGAGTSDEALTTALQEAVRAKVLADARQVFAAFEQERGQHDAAAEGLGPVVDALRKAQVDALFLHEERPSGGRDREEPTAVLYVGPDPFQVGTDAEEVRTLGAENPEPVRADAALLRIAVATDVNVFVVPQDEPDNAPHEDALDAPSVTDGVGALLRYSDASTASA